MVTPDEPSRQCLSYDYVLVGGGLHNALIVLALTSTAEPRRVALVERGERLGGNHTWCVHLGQHPGDGGPQQPFGFLDELVEFRWPGYEVRFPGRRRRLSSPYAGLTSARLHRVVSRRLAASPGCALFTGTEALSVGAHEVRLAGGAVLRGRLVIDGRGLEPPAGGAAGYQKFVGAEVELAAPHGITEPIVMDATVSQVDGFRFFYVLPLAADRLLVEDTRFADRAELEEPELRGEVRGWLQRAGLVPSRYLRWETGVLPMPWRGRGPRPGTGPLVAGYRGGWFHPATGYSFPNALRLARYLASVPPGAALGAGLQRLAARERRQQKFARLLNRLLFRWYLPADRRHVFERFYGLPEPTIERFYALRTTAGDRLRLLLGRPPRGLSLGARLTAGRRLDPARRLDEPACC